MVDNLFSAFHVLNMVLSVYDPIFEGEFTDKGAEA